MAVLSSTGCGVPSPKSSVSSWALVWASRGTIFHCTLFKHLFPGHLSWGQHQPLYVLEALKMKQSLNSHQSWPESSSTPFYKVWNLYLSLEVNYIPANPCPLPVPPPLSLLPPSLLPISLPPSHSLLLSLCLITWKQGFSVFSEHTISLFVLEFFRSSDKSHCMKNDSLSLQSFPPAWPESKHLLSADRRLHSC